MESIPSWSDWLKENDEPSAITPEPIRMSPARKARMVMAPEDRMSDEDKEKLEQQRIANNNRRREMRRKMMMMKKQKQQEQEDVEIEVSGLTEKPQALAQRDLNVPEVTVSVVKKTEMEVPVVEKASVSEVKEEKKGDVGRPKKAYESMTFDFGSDFNLDDLKLDTFSTSEISYELVDSMKSKIESQDNSPAQGKKTANTASSRLAERYNALKKSEKKKMEVSTPGQGNSAVKAISPVQRVPSVTRESPKLSSPEQPAPVISEPVISRTAISQPAMTQPSTSTISRYAVEDINAIKHQMVNNFTQMIDDYTPVLVDYINQEQNSGSLNDKVMSLEQQLAEMTIKMNSLTALNEKMGQENKRLKKDVSLLKGDKSDLKSQVDNLTNELDVKEKDNIQLTTFCEELLTRLESQ